MSAILPTYARLNLAVEEAIGSIVTDTNGKNYLDFTAGIGVVNLGHRHPEVQKAVETQLNKYWHMSNLYENPIQEKVATKLTKKSSGDYVFFSNSGAEANESAIKLARKASGKTKIITFNQSFHGRTFATMSATGQEKIQEGFGPLLETFAYTPYNDIDPLLSVIDNETAAIMLEVIQGEGGVVPATKEFIDVIQQISKDQNILIIVDEIQTGIARTGKAFAYQHYNLSPDIITSAKGLGNGLPVGAMIAKKELAQFFGPGSHGSTFGGNPIAMASANKVLELAFEDDFLQAVNQKGTYLIQKLEQELHGLSKVQAIRGKGLMIGIVYTEPVAQFVKSLLDKGLLILNAGPNVIRLLPPLTITNKEIDQAVSLIGETLKNDAL